jgi:LacI family transcriptional regulator
MPKKTFRLREIAEEAGLSLATVDRVINGRGQTSERAQKKISDAIKSLDSKTTSRRLIGKYLDVILPQNAGLSTEYLASFFKRSAEKRQINLRQHFVNRLDPADLEKALNFCLENETSGIAFQALEEAKIRAITLDTIARGIPITTIVSGLSGLPYNYVGLDNRAAGRTAAYMMSALNHSNGPIAVVWGGHLYHGHEEREFGFRSFFRNIHARTEIVDIRCSQDDANEAFHLVGKVLKKRTDLSGLYCVGGGIIGAVRALEEHRKKNGCVVIGHNLTANTRDFLLQNSVDIIIHQNMKSIADRTLEILTDENASANNSFNLIPIDIITKENIHENFDL